MNCYRCKYCDDFYDKCDNVDSVHFRMDVDDIVECSEYEDIDDDDE